MTAWFCGGDGVVTGGFLDTVGSAAGNACGTVAAAAAGQIPTATKFLSDYRGKFGADAGPYSAPAFDAMNALIQAIEQAYAAAGNKMPTRDQVSAQMLSIKTFHGVLGDFAFDPNGDITNRIISTFVTAQGTATTNDVSGSANTGWIWQFKQQKSY
jgi:branched-chain amino acid transport system substrate-binding protein